jgi:hypothetical protein
MPLDLDKFEQFASRLYIRNRDTGISSPLVFNYSQRRIQQTVKLKQRMDFPLFIILLKARRLGISTWGTAFLTAHAIAKKGSAGKQVAQLKETADELYEMSKDFGYQLRRRGVTARITADETVYAFPGRNGQPAQQSTISAATAKTVIGGRGLTCSALLLSEAAYYPGEDSFVSLLNTMSKDPDNVAIIESTANGMEGPGAVFHDYWNGAVDGSNGLIPIFLPWHEDPGLTMPEDMAADAPANEYERFLMRELHCTKSQVAWYRWNLEVKCAGSIAKMRQENPSVPEEAFISSGTPAFDIEEMAKAKKSECDPIAKGSLRVDEDGNATFHEGMGEFLIWEVPQPGAHYYVGVDAAKGTETGDFAAMTGINAETGNTAFRWADRTSPEDTAPIVNGACRLYNKAMVNIEFTGGWGYIIAKELRDRYHYPNNYFWRGRDDSVDTKGRKSMGWETNDRTRRMLIDLYRTAVRRGEAHPKDAAFIAQMSRASMELGWRWTVIKGHDDILMSGFLAWVAKEHYHIPHAFERKAGSTLPKDSDDPEQSSKSEKMPKWMTDPFTTSNGVLQWNSNSHLKKLELYNKQKGKIRPLDGI